MDFTSILFSGGIESVVATVQATRVGGIVRALHFDIGQESEPRELAVGNQLSMMEGNHLKVVDFSGVQQMFSGIMDAEAISADEADVICKDVSFLPGLIQFALNYTRQAGGSSLVIGLTKEQLAADNKGKALDMLFEANYLYEPDFIKTKLHMPFRNLTKAEVIKLAASLEISLENTWSCFRGGLNHCGRCASCLERKNAFELAGVRDPTIYQG